MAKLAKLLQAAAGAGGGEALNVEDVFSATLYTSTGTANTKITTGVDLNTDGGLLWTKIRSASADHYLFDTENAFDGALSGSISKRLKSNDTTALGSELNALTSFDTDGFTIGTNGAVNSSGSETYASWTFRKAPKFFDVQTWTGDGTTNRAIPHNLGGSVGCYFVKCTSDSTASDWVVWHKDLSANNRHLILNTTAAEAGYNLTSTTAPDSSNIYLGAGSFPNYYNATGRTYVAYIFAHNDGDGEFGPDGDADIIKCDSYTCAPTGIVDLGFEPQWIMIKRASGTGDWVMFDAMRGLVVEGNDAYVYANTSGAEVSNTRLNITPTGFSTDTTDYRISSNGETYIYIAIRRGPMAVPESASDVFDIATRINDDPSFVSSTDVVDMAIDRYIDGGSNYVASRLMGNQAQRTNTNAVDTGAYTTNPFDFNGGWLYTAGAAETNRIAYMWKRAPSFFDVVCYEGNGVEGHDIPHNLGAVPEMIWVKNRETASQDWYVYHKDLGNTHYLRLNATSAYVDSLDAWNDTTPTDSVFTVGGAGDVNWNGINHIAYLFTSLSGISKVGSYTGNGSSQTIDCGFSSGARFVLIKGYDSATNNWWVFDSERGIVAGNDGYLPLNETNAEVTSYDPIDPDSSGFIVNQVSGGSNTNYSGRNYIFYAIA